MRDRHLTVAVIHHTAGLFQILSFIALNATGVEHIIGNEYRRERFLADLMSGLEVTKMMQISGIGMGLFMTGVAVAISGLILEATFLMLGRALRVARSPYHLSL